MALGGIPALAVAYLHDEVHADHTAAAAAVFLRLMPRPRGYRPTATERRVRWQKPATSGVK